MTPRCAIALALLMVLSACAASAPPCWLDGSRWACQRPGCSIVGSRLVCRYP